jgi:hypothetical protein
LGIAQLVEQADLRGTATTTLGLTSVKHSWIRGALAAIGQYVLKQTLETGKIVRDTVVKEGVRQAMHHPDALAAAMIAFLAEAKPILVALANALHAQFGWITSLLSHVL